MVEQLPSSYGQGFWRAYAWRSLIFLPGPIIVIWVPPAESWIKITSTISVALLLMIVQSVEELVMSRRRAIGHDPRVPIDIRIEEDIHYLQRGADSLLTSRGESAFRASRHLTQKVDNLKATPKGRDALVSLLSDSSPVVRLIAAEAVVDWDPAVARTVAAEILAESAYFEWILERAAADLAQWGGREA